MKENTLTSSVLLQHRASRDEMGEYVAHLQLHMALQARNLVPHLSSDRTSGDSRSQLLQKTQADFEKIVSRQ